MRRLIWDDLHRRITEQTHREWALPAPTPLPSFVSQLPGLLFQSTIGAPYWESCQRSTESQKHTNHKEAGPKRHTSNRRAGRRMKADHQETDTQQLLVQQTKRADVLVRPRFFEKDGNILSPQFPGEGVYAEKCDRFEDISILVGHPTRSMQTSFRGGSNA